MNQVPIITSREEVLSEVTQALVTDSTSSFLLYRVSSAQEALDTLKFEAPVIVIVDFSDPEIEALSLLDSVAEDPWLQQTGIIALCDNGELVRRIDSIPGANVVIALRIGEIAAKIRTTLEIVYENQRILFQRALGSELIKNLTGVFYVKNDVMEAVCYSSILCNLLFSSNVISHERKQKLQLALHELLLNGIEHGNCEINYQQKTLWLEKGHAIEELIKQRCQSPEINKRRVALEYQIEPTYARFIITDQGQGFNWKQVAKFSLDEGLEGGPDLSLHGRGLFIAHAVTENLRFNEKGNQVCFEVFYTKQSGDVEQGLFSSVGLREVYPGEVIFSEGEPSNFLYYIASGEYDVIIKNKPVSRLSQEDVFMGEMSFLLNNVRSATIRARTRGKLIGISIRQFVRTLREKPHYSLFLCRLLAQRLRRVNRETMKKVDS